MQKIALATLLLPALGCLGCKQKPAADPVTNLSGDWSMVFGSDCKGYGLKSDNLSLRVDGTFDQVVVAQDGRRFESLGQHWKFSPPNSIELNKRRNFFTTQNYKELIGVSEFEVLIVKFDPPLSILLHPDSDCFYAKTQ